MLQSVAVCCSVLECVVVCRSVLQCVAVCWSVLQCVVCVDLEMCTFMGLISYEGLLPDLIGLLDMIDSPIKSDMKLGPHTHRRAASQS